MDGIPPPVIGVTFFIGWFEATLPMYIKRAKNIALLYIDSDLYSSAKTVLWELNAYILPKTIIVFDDWAYESHEQKAFYEWVDTFKRDFVFIPHKENNLKQEGYRAIVKIVN